MICLTSRYRLNVGVFCAEEFAEAVAGKVFDDVVELTAAVVALSRVAFGILVRENRSDRFKDGFADYVLGCD